MKRIKTPQSQGRDYEKMLKDYFGKYLYGLDVRRDGGRPSVQLVYFDFKHTDTVRRELVQMMPEVEFTKLKRMFTDTAEQWVIRQMMMDCPDRFSEPVIYVQRGDALVKSSLRDIALTELNQIELEDGDITYDERSDLSLCHPEDADLLQDHSFD